MSAGPQYEYLWADGLKVGAAVLLRVAAPLLAASRLLPP